MKSKGTGAYQAIQIVKANKIYFYAVSAILFFFIFSNFAMANRNRPFDKIIFFGDSLTDNGALYTYLLGQVPKSPPYFDGRFSNGYLWSEMVAKYFYDKDYIGTKNYAVGGETAVLHPPLDGYVPYTLSVSINNYLLRSAFSDRSNALFIIWIGGNDYLHGATDVDQFTNNVVQGIKTGIEKLIDHGSQNFIIVDLPSIALLPYGREKRMTKVYDAIASAHNAKLNTMISELTNAYPNIAIQLFPAGKLLKALISDPEYYNKKYNIHLINTTSGCWPKHNLFTSGSRDEREYLIQQQIENHMKTSKISGFSSAHVDSKSLSHHILSTPELYEAYQVSDEAERGIKPCKNPNEYIFWDNIHPTAIVHFMLSRRMIEFIEQNYTHA